MLYKEYDEKTLHRLQQIELEILRDFDELCTENGLSYFGCGGTAIGAVRHHGMIPWDDDIDVGLLRKDYKDRETEKIPQKIQSSQCRYNGELSAHDDQMVYEGNKVQGGRPQKY